MQPVIVSTSATGTYAGAGGTGIPVDIHASSFGVAVYVVGVSGTPAINVEVSPNSPFVSSTAMYWLRVIASASATAVTKITTPFQALRVVQTEVGNANVIIIQEGMYGK